MSGEKSKKARLAALKVSDPVCCHCGVRATGSLDHAPARICFKGRIGPEGYEVPACEPCNFAVRKTENVIALWIRMSDRTPENFSETDLDALISSVKNNAPECLPGMGLSANQKRRALQERGQRLEPGETYADAAVADIPAPVQSHMELFARKMISALFYRETRKFLGHNHALVLTWFQAGSPASTLSSQRASEWFGDLIIGKRQNTDIRRQFVYRYGYHPAHGFFGLWMEFGTLQFFSIAGPKDQIATLQARDLVKDMIKEWMPLDVAARTVLGTGKS